jgi:hypothetical protein
MLKACKELPTSMSQKRHAKNLKRKQKKPYISKFDRKQAKIREQIIREALIPIQTSLLNNLDKNNQASQHLGDIHHNIASHPTALL